MAETTPNLDGMSVKELLALIESATAKLAQKREEEKASFVAEMRQKAAERGLSLEDLFGKSAPAKGRQALPPKYRGPSGQEWAGRGVTPNWLKNLESSGHSRDEYLVK